MINCMGGSVTEETDTAFLTNSVVAILVVESPEVGVGASGKFVKVVVPFMVVVPLIMVEPVLPVLPIVMTEFVFASVPILMAGVAAATKFDKLIVPPVLNDVVVAVLDQILFPFNDIVVTDN